MHLLPDEEVMDFTAGGSLRAFAELCRRKAPYLVVYGLSNGCAAELARRRTSAALIRLWRDAALSEIDDVDFALTVMLRGMKDSQAPILQDCPADMAGFVRHVAQAASRVAQAEPAEPFWAPLRRRCAQIFKSAPSGSTALVPF